MSSGDILTWFPQFRAEYEALEDSLPTFLEIIDRPGSEQYWQSILAYFLDPSETHGFGSDVTDAFLRAVEDHPETTASDLTRAVESVYIETEAATPPSGRADILLWAPEEWFVCIEMKIDADESDEQTERYAKADRIGPISTEPYKDSTDQNHQFVYLAPATASSPVRDDEFAEITWKDIVSQIEAVLKGDTARPQQSQEQLDEYLQTIKKYLNMDEFGHISNEALLYGEYREQIESLDETFYAERERLKTRLKAMLTEEFGTGEWGMRMGSESRTWVQLYRHEWRQRYDANHALNVEYEPQIKLDTQPPRVDVQFDIEKGIKSEREELREELLSRLDSDILTREGWTRNDGKAREHLTRSFILDSESPDATLQEVVASIRSFHDAAGEEIEAAVWEVISE